MKNSTNNKFSGWIVLTGCFIVMFFVLGGLQTFAVFLPSIMKDTKFSLTAIATTTTMATLAAFVSNLALGSFLKKLTAKYILLVGVSITCLGFVVMSIASTLPVLYIGAILAGFASALGTVAPVSLIMTNWFITKRATYTSIAIAGSMFGGAVLMPLCGEFIAMFGWRIAYRILAALVLSSTVLTIIFLITDKPEDKGQKPYNHDMNATKKKSQQEQVKNEQEENKQERDEQKIAELATTPVKKDFGAYKKENTNGGTKEITGIQVKDVRSSLSFWLLMVGVLLIGCSTNIENFLPVFWQSKGMDVATSSRIMGIYALITALCTIFLGRITDKLGAIPYTLLTSIFFILGTISVFYVGASSIPFIFCALFLFAAGAKKTSTLTPPLVVLAAFGRKDFGATIGYFTAMMQLGIALSNPIIGSLYALHESYNLPFFVMAGINGLALLLILIALKIAPTGLTQKTSF